MVIRAKKRKSLSTSAKKKLKNLFSENGEFTMLNDFLIETQKRVKTERNNDLEILSIFLKEVGKFQDRNFVKFSQMEKTLKKRMQLKTQKQLFEFNEILSVCGRDSLKNPEHQTKIKNENMKGHFSTKRCFINSSFTQSDKSENYQPLSYCMGILEKKSGAIPKAEYIEIKDTAKKYLLENTFKLLSSMDDIRESMKMA